MKKFFSNLFVIIYAIFAIFITICLLSYNDYRVSEFGNYSFIIIQSNDIKGGFSKGSLLIIDRDEEPEIGEKTFFYNTSKKNEIALAELKNKEKITSSETTYTFEGNKLVSSKYIIGSSEHAKEIKNAGTILSIAESKWGYLFLVVFPSLIAFLYEITKVVEEMRENKSTSSRKSTKH